MPSRNRSREAAKARQEADAEAIGPKTKKQQRVRNKKKRRPKKSVQAGGGTESSMKAGAAGRRRPKTGPMFDPSADDNAEVRFVMPGAAVKVYLCPGCNRDIAVGVGHIVAVPPDAPDLRRHWHRGCWDNRHSRF